MDPLTQSVLNPYERMITSSNLRSFGSMPWEAIDLFNGIIGGYTRNPGMMFNPNFENRGLTFPKVSRSRFPTALGTSGFLQGILGGAYDQSTPSDSLGGLLS